MRMLMKRDGARGLVSTGETCEGGQPPQRPSLACWPSNRRDASGRLEVNVMPCARSAAPLLALTLLALPATAVRGQSGPAMAPAPCGTATDRGHVEWNAMPDRPGTSESE